MTNLTNLTLEELTDFIVQLGGEKFRAKQVFGWISKGKTDFREMTNLPEVFKQKMEESSYVGYIKPLEVQTSKTDGTKKYLFQLDDDNVIESVFMKYKYGNSICVSSQAGCRMGCKFCASGKNGLARNLTSGEILSQILAVEKNTGEKINHIVIMGTGEPFDNYEQVSNFFKIVNNKEGLNIGMRNITLSTCGLANKIEKLADDFPQVNLAISLHGTTDKIRSSMMPINDSFPIDMLLAKCRKYVKKTKRRITFEYTVIKGVNDSDTDAVRLAALLKGMLCHVNVIPLNKVEGFGFDSISRKRAIEFKEILEKNGITATVRRELGADIEGACGQLRLGKL